MILTQHKVLLAGIVVVCATAQLTGCRRKKETLYDPTRVVAEQMETAYKEAEQTNKSILVVFGGDWCSWCMRLHEVFLTDPAVSATINRQYVVVYVDSDSNVGFARHCKAQIESVPYLTILDSSGQVLVNQRTEPFESGRTYNMGKLQAFLDSYGPAAAPPKSE